MDHEKSLIDSFLSFNVSNQKSVDGNNDGRIDGETREETPSYRRLSDPPSTNDSLLFGNVPTTGVGGTRPSSTSLGGGEKQLGQRDIYSANEFNRSPARFKPNSDHQPAEFSSDSFALGAISRYTTDEESTSARFPNVAPIETNNSYIIREPEDNSILGRKNLSSKVMFCLYMSFLVLSFTRNLQFAGSQRPPRRRNPLWSRLQQLRQR